MMKESFVPVIIFLIGTTIFRKQSTPDFSVAEHYGLQNTMCLYSQDVTSDSHELAYQ
jgi:hypothetical protein